MSKTRRLGRTVWPKTVRPALTLESHRVTGKFIQEAVPPYALSTSSPRNPVGSLGYGTGAWRTMARAELQTQSVRLTDPQSGFARAQHGFGRVLSKNVVSWIEAGQSIGAG
jgi:hypothetical protein